MKALITAFLAIVSIASFAQKPTITAVDRMNAGYQDIVTLQGSNFGTDSTKLAAFFGGAKGIVNFTSDQLIEVSVPAGATYDKIAVSNITSGLTGYTPENFLFSFGGEHGFGAANLEGQKDFSVESGLYDLCLCDFDGDGKTDIATASDNSNSIAVLSNTSAAPGLANINFTKKSFLINAHTIHATCGDLNGDGKPDMVISEGGETGDRIFIFHNTSTGVGNFTFSPQFIKLTGKRMKQVKIGDLDLDGKPELIVTNQSGNNITVLVNQSTSSSITFSTTPITITIPGASTTDGVAIDDLNGDRLPEIIVSQFLTANSDVYILRNNSTTGNIDLGNQTTISVSNTVVNLKVGDLDGDQKPDIAVTQLLGSSISVFLNQSSASTISFSTPTPIATEERPWGIDFGDLDGDGKTDIAVASLSKKFLTILNNESTPGSLAFQTIFKPTTYINRHIAIGDIDGDAKPDIAFTSIDDNINNIRPSAVSVFRNTVCMKPEVDPEGPHTICSGFPLQLTTTASPGTTYEWKNNNTTVVSGTDSFFDVTVSGDYTVTAIAEGGACSLTSNEVNVTVDPGNTTGTAEPDNNGPVCIGSALTLSVNDVGGTEYKWTGPEGYTGTGLNPASIPDFQQVNAGRYYLDVIVNTCVAQQVSTVVEAIAVPEFQINTGGAAVVCPPDTKTLTITPAPGTFTYQWFEKTSGILADETSASFNATATGEYYVEAEYTANPACAAIKTDPVKITFATNPVPAFTLPATACMGQTITFTNQSTSDPSATVSYHWDFGDGQTSTEAEPVHQFTSASEFSVKLSVSYENDACNADLSKNIDIQPAPVATISNPENQFSLCPGDSLTLEVLGAFTSYQWSTEASTQSILVEEGGVYTVDVTTDAGCIITATREVTLLEEPEITATADPAEIAEGESTQLEASGVETYTWEPVETLSDANLSNPVATPLTSTVYKVTGTDANGCQVETTIEVVVREGSVYGKLIPSKFFSPGNGDEIGNFWIVDRIEDFPYCQVSVYDVKGIKVHEAKPYLNDWDGTFKGASLPDGVYYFIIKCEGEENSPKTGSITILR